MALKRGGRGHDPAGIDATSNGELTVECPACPHPGRNLPDGWENAGALLYVSLHFSSSFIYHPYHTQYRFLYTLFLAIDGNFKLKGKERGVEDIELMPGWGAYCPEAEYKSHIANYVDQKEVRAPLYFVHPHLILLDRLTHASLGMMPWFVHLLDQHQGIQSLEPWSLFAQDIA
jgi:hypothetical protein